MTFVVNHTDCLVYLKTVADNTFDSVVTDPPYGLGFMGKNWDKALPDKEIWKECLRVLKPGGHMVVFGAPRIYHRLTCQIEDAGFEVRDCLMWLFGSGFPKSLNVSKAIDAAAGAEREVIGFDASRVRPNRLYEGGAIGNVGGTGKVSDRTDNGATITAPSTAEAILWEGWGTALKPAYEPILLVRKPLEGTVASNVLKWGTGGLNIDGCRIGKRVPGSLSKTTKRTAMTGPMMSDSLENSGHNENIGRWPANIVLDEEVGNVLDEQTGTLTSGSPGTRRKQHATTAMAGKLGLTNQQEVGYADSGGASRFFYCAKTSKSERELGLEDQESKTVKDGRKAKADNPRLRGETERKNTHPTVKPISLMSWLVRLVTPQGGTVLDPFTGSGSTGCATVQEGFNFVGCELEEEYVKIARLRIEAVKTK